VVILLIQSERREKGRERKGWKWRNNGQMLRERAGDQQREEEKFLAAEVKKMKIGRTRDYVTQRKI